MSDIQKKNQATFELMKLELLETFPLGHFVAFDDGILLADAVTFDLLTDKLEKAGRNRPDVFVVQVAAYYPDQVLILQ